MPLTLLDGTPFSDFLIPGSILFTVLGLGSCIGWWLAFYRSSFAVRWVQVVGLGTVIWILVQVIIMDAVDVLHVIYGAVGVGILFLSPEATLVWICAHDRSGIRCDQPRSGSSTCWREPGARASTT